MDNHTGHDVEKKRQMIQMCPITIFNPRGKFVYVWPRNRMMEND